MSDPEVSVLPKEEVDNLLRELETFRDEFHIKNWTEEEYKRLKHLSGILDRDLRTRTEVIIEAFRQTAAEPAICSIIAPSWERLEHRIDALWYFWMLTIPWIGKNRLHIENIKAIVGKIAEYRSKYQECGSDMTMYYPLLYSLLGDIERYIPNRQPRSADHG